MGLRILFISRRYFPTISGMSVYAFNLIKQLVAAGHEVSMISQFRADPIGAGVYGGGPPPDIPGAKVIGLESEGEVSGDFESDVEAIVETARDLHARQPFDIVHAQYGYPPGLAALECSAQLGIPSVVSIQGGDGRWVGMCCRFHRAAMQAVLRHSSAVLIGSRSFRDEVVEKHDIDPERFTIIPGGVDCSWFTPRPSERTATEGVPTILFHGRIDARKGVFDLLRAVELIRSRRVRLVFSGIGPDSSGLAREVASSTTTNQVELTGYVDYASSPDVYRTASMFVSPTYSEGFSNTILEAMATGLPIVSTSVVGVVDCLRDGENALLVPAAEPEAIASAIVRLLGDPGLARRLGEAALAEVRQLYSWERMADRIVAAYRSVVGTSLNSSWTLPTERDDCRFRRAPHLL